MLCLRVDSEVVYKKIQSLLQHLVLKDAVHLPSA